MIPYSNSGKVGEWQPIETAPKDGTKILVYTVHGDVELSDWYSISYPSYELCGVNDETGEGIYRKIAGNPTEGWNSNMPTHWMPLPEPPK